MPEYYQVFSRYGTFTVHASRCLIFRNGGELPERSASWHLWPWGIPEAYRVWKALREAETAHGSAVRLLDKSIQPIQKIHGLSQLLETSEGDAQVMRQIEIADFSRGLFHTVAVAMDADFSFLGEVPEGIGKVVNISDQMLSAVTGIPEIILWGKSIDYERPGQMLRNHDNTSMANWYDLVERIQSGMVKHNLRRLLSVIFQASVNRGELSEPPPLDVRFSPLWAASAMDEADAKLARARKQLTQAKEAETYVSMGAIRPAEIRKGLFKKSHKRR